MIAACVYDSIKMIGVSVEENARESWIRVVTFYKYGEPRVSDLSPSLAYRILPRLFDRLGIHPQLQTYRGIMRVGRVVPAWASAPVVSR